MKRILSYLVVALLGALLTNLYFAYRLSANNVSTVSELESKYNSLHQRLSVVESNTRQMTRLHVWGFVSTTDQAESDRWPFERYRTNKTEGYLIDDGFKGGPAIAPEIRIPAGSTNIHEFEVRLSERMTTSRLVDAWGKIRPSGDDFSAFERFYVYSSPEANTFKLVMQLKPGSSVKSRFDLTILHEHTLK